jgi:hypothetical protein
MCRPVAPAEPADVDGVLRAEEVDGKSGDEERPGRELGGKSGDEERPGRELGALPWPATAEPHAASAHTASSGSA